MKPCSIVIEIFPWVYHSPEFYGGLARRAGLIYYEWQVSYRDTELYLDVKSEQKCKKVFEEVIQISDYDVNSNLLSQKDSDRANAACFKVENCRMCAQYWAIKGLNISINQLNATINQAIMDRTRCISENPFYNSSRAQGSYPFTQNVPYLKDGLLVKGSGKSVFLLDKGSKRAFGSGGAFLKMGFDFGEVVHISDELLSSIPSKDSIE
jgi:hypothetical protein